MPTKSQPIVRPLKDRLELENVLRDYLLVSREDTEGVLFLNKVLEAFRRANRGRTAVISGDKLFSSMVVDIFKAYGLPFREAISGYESVSPHEFGLRVPGPNHRREDLSLILSFMFGRVVEAMTAHGESPPTWISGYVIQRIWCEPRWRDFTEIDQFIDAAMTVECRDGKLQWDWIVVSLFDEFPRLWSQSAIPASVGDHDARSVFSGNPVSENEVEVPRDWRAVFEAHMPRVVSYLHVNDRNCGSRPHFFAINTVGRVVKNCQKLSNEWPARMIEEISDYIIELRNRILRARNELLSGPATEPPLEWDEQRERDAFEREGICTSASYHSVMADTNLGISFEEIDDTYEKWKLAADRLGVRRAQTNLGLSRGESTEVTRDDTESDNVFRLQGNIFRRNGELWEVAFGGGDAKLFKAGKGFSYIHAIISANGKEISATELVQGDSLPPSFGTTEEPSCEIDWDQQDEITKGQMFQNDLRADHKRQEKLDRLSIKQIRAMIATLEEKIEEDPENETLQNERDFLKDELSKNRGLGGTSRTFREGKEKCRDSVRKALDRAYDDVERINTPLATHLRNCISRGDKLSYKSDPPINWAL